MISWQRLLSARFLDPLVGRDVLLGILVGSATAAVFMGVLSWAGTAGISPVNQRFGLGLLPSIGVSVGGLGLACFSAISSLALLAMMTGLLRRRWLGLAVTGLVLVLLNDTSTVLVSSLSAVYTLIFLILLTRVGIVACTGYVLIMLGDPPR
jgi:hypothetical protein